MKLKFLFYLFILCFIPHSILAQKIVFCYDSCGNMISKTQAITMARLNSTKISLTDDSYKDYKIDNYHINIGPSPTMGNVNGQIVDFEGNYTVTAYDPRLNRRIISESLNNMFSMNINSFSTGYVILSFKIDGKEVPENIKIIKK